MHNKEYRREYYRKNKAKFKIYSKRNYEKTKGKVNTRHRLTHWARRLNIISAYGGQCQCCSEAEPKFLTIDHIDGKPGPLEGKTKLEGTTLYRFLCKENYPKDNYQLLCINCNFAKGHWGSCPHTAGCLARPTSLEVTVCR